MLILTGHADPGCVLDDTLINNFLLFQLRIAVLAVEVSCLARSLQWKIWSWMHGVYETRERQSTFEYDSIPWSDCN